MVYADHPESIRPRRDEVLAALSLGLDLGIDGDGPGPARVALASAGHGWRWCPAGTSAGSAWHPRYRRLTRADVKPDLAPGGAALTAATPAAMLFGLPVLVLRGG